MKQQLDLAEYQKTTELYLRALWGRGFVLKGIAIDNVGATLTSYISENVIHLPESLQVNVQQTLYYRAAATHASLHLLSNQQAFEVGDLNYLQRYLIGLIEDLRLELSAIKMFPGLRQLWLAFHPVAESRHISTLQLLLRLSRSVLDPTYQDDHHWVVKGRHKVLTAFHHNQDASEEVVRQVGLSLANDLGQMRLPLNTGKYEQLVMYRDDNRYLWQDNIEYRQQIDSANMDEYSVDQQAKLIESSSGMSLRLADHPVQQGKGYQLFEKEHADLEYRQVPPTHLLASRKYPEWDYRIQTLKRDWCCIKERVADVGSPAVIEDIMNRHRIVLSRLRRLASRLRVEKQQ